MPRFYPIIICLFLVLKTNGQITRVEPPNWWVGMQNSHLQLLVYGKDISTYSAKVVYEGISLVKETPGVSENYLFLDLVFGPNTKPGILSIEFQKEGQSSQFYNYELKSRSFEPTSFEGFDSKDVIYLITPDRFANGNIENDISMGSLEKDLDRSHDYKRHGGDIDGIINHLDYIAEMGFTAIWSSPVLSNNMPEQSYHGYAITDFYEVDSRFGTLEEYKELSKKADEKGLKLIMDQVVNHCGRHHWWMNDLPFTDWINYQSDFEEGKKTKITNHRRSVNQDLYASEIDKKIMEEGWFVPSMPDLNQQNSFMANYLIQNSIWWIETLNLGGIRQDTYPYSNKGFLADWAHSIMLEYPNFNIVGEEWSYNPLLVGYWQEGNKNKDQYQSGLLSTMDFPLQKVLIDALKEPESWDKGLIKLYEALANDFYYPNPQSILLFGDNHDMDRMFTQLNQDVSLTQMALAFILTAPRIPQIYYGTEVLLENSKKPGDHGLIRTDFPGGWPNDEVNGFTTKGLSTNQKNMQGFLRKLLNFRKNSKAIHSGKTVHFAPENGVYTLFRYHEESMVILVLNKNDSEINLAMNRFNEMGVIGKMGLNVLSDEQFKIANEIRIAPKSATLISIRE
ncbi:glycoside hydrolase family 13 protein [Croceivirga thetidis]|uniref:Glycoside hydrolase family 13 protein n=1 Tax=Croceivirga thetidis TaxID=2721623 RepID=A0ABX1GP06_9FLAO|nr:glycoside hydrolase family 13 protein [Croceivirga thetidis]NKI31629.1 glycoside hydrolase family 13 protein [Croceivirga thetidis]